METLGLIAEGLQWLAIILLINVNVQRNKVVLPDPEHAPPPPWAHPDRRD